MSCLITWHKSKGCMTLGEISIFAFNNDKLHEIFYRIEFQTLKFYYETGILSINASVPGSSGSSPLNVNSVTWLALHMSGTESLTGGLSAWSVRNRFTQPIHLALSGVVVISVVPADIVIARKSHGVNLGVYADTGPKSPFSPTRDGRINLLITTKGLELKERSQCQLSLSLLISLSQTS